MSAQLDTTYPFTGQSLVGLIFGSLTVERYAGHNAKLHKFFWSCKCSCGDNTVVPTGNLKSGTSTSCGCLRIQKIRQANTKHGQTTSKGWHRLYRVWLSMRSRCNNPKVKYWKWYGGKGIKVCPEWDDFSVFLADMGPTWKEGLELERIDGNLGYSKSNCCWKSHFEQMQNTTKCRLIEYQGRTQNMSQWAREFGIKFTTLQSRLRKGWTIQDALTRKEAA